MPSSPRALPPASPPAAKAEGRRKNRRGTHEVAPSLSRSVRQGRDFDFASAESVTASSKLQLTVLTLARTTTNASHFNHALILIPHFLNRSPSRPLSDRAQRRRSPRQSRPRRLRRRHSRSGRKQNRRPQRIPRPPDQQLRRISRPYRCPRIRRRARSQSPQTHQRLRTPGPADQRHLQSKKSHAARPPRPRQKIDRPTRLVQHRPRSPRTQSGSRPPRQPSHGQRHRPCSNFSSCGGGLGRRKASSATSPTGIRRHSPQRSSGVNKCETPRRRPRSTPHKEIKLVRTYPCVPVSPVLKGLILERTGGTQQDNGILNNRK